MRCASISPRSGSVFKPPDCTSRPQIPSQSWISVWFANKMGFERSTKGAKMWSHLQHERPILIVGSWSGHGAGKSHMRWMMDKYRWQVAQRRFFAHQHSGKLFRNAEISCDEIDFWCLLSTVRGRSSRIVKRRTITSPS